MDNILDGDGIHLTNPINVQDLLNGSCFEIQSNFDDTYNSSELFNDTDDFDEEAKNKFKCPWTQKFEDLKTTMHKVSDYMYKRIEKNGVGNQTVPQHATVKVDYNGYFENSPTPYDSTFLRGAPETHYVSGGAISVGFSKAIQTMKIGEEAWFWISYNLLFGQLGCPPRIPPKADAVIFIKLWKFEELGNNEDVERYKYDKSFKSVVKIVESFNLSAKSYFYQKKYSQAIILYNKAVQALEMSLLKDEEEQRQQQAFLIKLYTNLCVCYNKKDEPKKTCLMVKELRCLMNVDESPKILFAEGRALTMLSEFSRARAILLKAQRLEPSSCDIIRSLQELEKRTSDAKQYEIEAAKRAMQIFCEAEELQAKKLTNGWEELEEMRQGILREVNRFKESKETRLNLPDHFSSAELTIVEDIAKSLQLKLNITQYENKTYYLSKN